jgi:transmembrane sensor
MAYGMRLQRERNMKTRDQDEPSVLQQAQYWHRVLPDADPAQRKEFVAWICRSPEHLQVFLLHSVLTVELTDLDAYREVNVARLLTKVSSTTVVHLHGPPSNRLGASDTKFRRPSRRRWRAAIVAGLALMSFVAWLTMQSLRPPSVDYVTQTGEQLRVPLTDGTFIELNTQSHIRVAYSAQARDVALLSGEALFVVRHDALRPFRVHIDHTMIEDLGTQFSVYRRADSTTTLSVIEGNVQVSSDPAPSPWFTSPPKSSVTALPGRRASEPLREPARVDAGQEVRIVASGELLRREKVDATHTAAWRQHQLWFDGSSLSEVSAEFNRYNIKEIRIDPGESIARKRYSGTFDAYDPDSFVQFIRQDPTLLVVTDDRHVFIRGR